MKRRQGKCCKKQKIIGTYRNDNIKVLLKSYQIETTGTNKPELRDGWKDILDNMDLPPPCKKWIAE